MRAKAKALLSGGAFVPAMPLALNAKREFDEAAQRRLLRYYMAAGADGIAVCVHTTQFAVRDAEVNLYEKLLDVAADEISAHERRSGRAIIKIAGVCGPVAQALNEANTASRLGYDAALLSPGGLRNISEAALLARTREVASVMDVIGFYLQAAVGGRALSYDYWRELTLVPGVAAIKCAAFNRYQTLDVARAIANADNDIALYTGNDDNIIVDLLTEYDFGGARVRARGGLLGHWAVWTHTAVELFREIRAHALGQPIPAYWLALASQITDANGAFFDARNGFKGCIAGIHEVLRRQGLLNGIWCIDPLETLSPGQAEEIDRVYEAYPHLNDDAFVCEFLKGEV